MKYRLQQLEQFFKNLVNLFKKMINRKDKGDAYIEVLEDMRDHKIISTETYDNVLGYEEQDKEKDDFEL